MTKIRKVPELPEHDEDAELEAMLAEDIESEVEAGIDKAAAEAHNNNVVQRFAKALGAIQEQDKPEGYSSNGLQTNEEAIRIFKGHIASRQEKIVEATKLLQETDSNIQRLLRQRAWLERDIQANKNAVVAFTNALDYLEVNK